METRLGWLNLADKRRCLGAARVAGLAAEGKEKQAEAEVTQGAREEVRGGDGEKEGCRR